MQKVAKISGVGFMVRILELILPRLSTRLQYLNKHRPVLFPSTADNENILSQQNRKSFSPLHPQTSQSVSSIASFHGFNAAPDWRTTSNCFTGSGVAYQRYAGLRMGSENASGFSSEIDIRLSVGVKVASSFYLRRFVW